LVLTGLTDRGRSFTAPESGCYALQLVNWDDESTEVKIDAAMWAAGGIEKGRHQNPKKFVLWYQARRFSLLSCALAWPFAAHGPGDLLLGSAGAFLVRRIASLGRRGQ
jgi:hypothetical protein